MVAKHCLSGLVLLFIEKSVGYGNQSSLILGPLHWPHADGLFQSPIDIDSSVVEKIDGCDAMKFVNYHRLFGGEIVNNGHSGAVLRPFSANPSHRFCAAPFEAI